MCIATASQVLGTPLEKNEKHFKTEQRTAAAAAQKRANTSGVEKSSNYYEDIYIPPYSNTH